jgi:hypothetical protein
MKQAKKFFGTVSTALFAKAPTRDGTPSATEK